MTARELDAAGITRPALRASYAACERLHARHGRTYHLATRLLPAHKRPHVAALYGFARHADEIVDDVTAGDATDQRAVRLDALAADFVAARGTGPVLPAVLHTAQAFGIDRQLFLDFLASMRMDLTVTSYATYDDLLAYMHGSAAVIGEQMLPILGTTVPRRIAAPYARDLGIAFQLTNFVRDVGEDLRRGRGYLPAADLEAFSVDRADLALGVLTSNLRELLAFEVRRARGIYRTAAAGVRLLDPTSRPCIETALALYGGILDAVERADYAVLDQRVAVSVPRRLAVAIPGLVRARAARRGGRATPTAPASS